MIRLALVLSLGAAAIACSPVPPLAHTHESAAALASAVLDAYARKDGGTLTALALNEQEFRDQVWPELPAARPERNLPFSYVWGDLRQKSSLSLEKTLAEHGGRRYELIDVGFEGETRYSSYLVHRRTTIRARGDGGQPIELRVLGSMIEQDGAWKVFSYVVDD
jgi:hypothetical protein